WVWGANTEGELGNQANVDINHPFPNNVFFPEGTQLTTLAAGSGEPSTTIGSHILGVASDGKLFAWGHDSDGQVGEGQSADSVFGPVQVCAAGQTAPCTQFLDSIIAAAAGIFHSLALDGFSNVWAWGNNDFGQLGADLGGGARASLVPIRNNALL